MQTLLSGRGLVESPRWHGDRLYFSDWSAGEVLAVGPAGGSDVIARAAALWRGMNERDMVSPGSGQILATVVEVPGAGSP